MAAEIYLRHGDYLQNHVTAVWYGVSRILGIALDFEVRRCAFIRSRMQLSSVNCAVKAETMRIAAHQ